VHLSTLVSIALRLGLELVVVLYGEHAQIRKLIRRCCYPYDHMPSVALSELDSLFHQLQRRMVESGEWDRYGHLYFKPVAQSLNILLYSRV
jgi:hypothetical protein